MANGSSKHGDALADRFRERRAEPAREAREAIRRFRDSIDLEDGEGEHEQRPAVIVNLAPEHLPKHRSFSESLRPVVEKVRAAKTILMIAGAIAGAVAGAVEALRQLGVLK